MLLLIFQLGNDRYAVDTGQVIEVLSLVNLKSIPRAPAGVAGLFNYHGAPVPLIDLTELATGKSSRKWMSTRIIVVNYREDSGEERVLGLMAEQATETLRRMEGDFAPSRVSDAGSPYLGPVTMDAAGIIQRLEIKKLLSESVRTQLLMEQMEPAQ